MAIFYLMYLFLLGGWYFSNQLAERQRRIFICATSFLVLWLIQSLRALTVGRDLINYIPFFLSTDYKEVSENIEIGYLYFNRFIYNYITTDPHVFLSIVSACILLPFTIVVKKYSKIPALSFIIFASFVIYIFSFSALRQSIAIGLTTLSYIFVEEKKLLPFLLLVFIASTIHTSAIIFIIVYPCCNYINLNKKTYIILTISLIFLISSLKSVIQIILPFIFSEGKYDSYIETNASPAYNLLILIVLFYIASFFIKRPDTTDKNMRFFLFLSVACQSLGLISPAAPRIGFYFFIFIGIALTNIIKNGNFTHSSKKLGITFIFVTHDQEEALAMSDEIFVLNEGKIQQSGSPVDIYDEPVNDFVARFIGESNILPGRMIKDFEVEFGNHTFECADAGIKSGEKVEVVIRPEDLDITSIEKGKLRAVVQSQLFLGDHFEIKAKDSDENEWLIHSTNPTVIGKEVGLFFDPEDIHVMRFGESEEEFDKRLEAYEEE